MPPMRTAHDVAANQKDPQSLDNHGFFVVNITDISEWAFIYTGTQSITYMFYDTKKSLI